MTAHRIGRVERGPTDDRTNIPGLGRPSHDERAGGTRDPGSMGVLTAVREGAVFVIALTRPAVHNAFDRRQSEELAGAIDRFEAEPGLRVAVLTGSGTSFCSGSDFAAMEAGESLAVDPRGEYG